MTRQRLFFTLQEAARILRTEMPAAFDAAQVLPQSFKVDSRLVKPGDAFVACRGEHTDGHRYIGAAAEAGAALILAERSYYAEHADEFLKIPVPVLTIDNAERGLAELARAWLAGVAPAVVGITGSVGKTTTREILRSVLHKHVRTHTAIKSYNTLIGCGLTILAMPADTQVLILELGTNHPGEIAEMVSYFPVTHGIITDAVPAHLEGLSSLEGVVKAKTELLDSQDMLFLSYNNDNEPLIAAIEKHGGVFKKIGVGIADGDLRIGEVRQEIDSEAVPRLSFDIQSSDVSFRCVTPIFGKQHARNVAYAFAAANELGVAPQDFTASIADISLPKGRGGILRAAHGNMIVDESYNANPSSVSQAIKNVVELKTGEDVRKIAILGGMRELGPESAKWHEIVMSRASLLDGVYLIGEEWRGIETQQISLCGKWTDRAHFARDFDFSHLSNSVVLLKGSRFYELERLLPAFGAMVQ